MSFTQWIETDTITGAAAIYNLKTMLKAAAWTVPSSSDGTTYNAAGDQISSGAAGANGMANNSAWFRIQDPGGVVEYTIQRGTANTVWRVKCSALAKFTGGSPGNTQTPSATDEGIILGTGTDAVPGYETLFGADNGYRYKGGADVAAPYHFWSVAFPIGGGVVTHCFIHEGLDSVEPTDGAPFHTIIGSTNITAIYLTGESKNSSWTVSWSPRVAAVPGASIVIPALVLTNFTPDSCPVNPISGKDESFPIPYGRRSAIANSGWKGVGIIARWTGISRTTGDTFTLSSARDRIVFGQISVPWNGNVPTV